MSFTPRSLAIFSTFKVDSSKYFLQDQRSSMMTLESWWIAWTLSIIFALMTYSTRINIRNTFFFLANVSRLSLVYSSCSFKVDVVNFFVRLAWTGGVVLVFACVFVLGIFEWVVRGRDGGAWSIFAGIVGEFVNLIPLVKKKQCLVDF